MKKIGAESYELSTGKIIFPKCTRIFLDEVKEGDGGIIGEYMYEVFNGHDNSPDLTKNEAAELAAYMSNLWLNIAIILK